jgi:hypothetical protein
MSAAESYALFLIELYSPSEKEWMMTLFKTTQWEMLDILNAYHACGNREATELVFTLASQFAIHPSDIYGLIHSFPK